MATSGCEDEYREASQLRLSVCGSYAFYLIWVFANLVPPPSSLTVTVHWQFLGTPCFILALSTLRCIITTLGIGSPLSTREIGLAYVPMHENIADLFMKAMPKEKFEAFHKALGLLPFVDWSLSTLFSPSLYMTVSSWFTKSLPRGIC